jgi:small subunit ribosomal protein S6
MNRIYEELFIIRPDATEEEVNPFIEQIKTTITNGKGTVDKVDNWGVRRLAYRVKKRNEGIYVLIVFSGPATMVYEVERRMRVSDLVLKFINVRIDEKIKKIEKRKKIREKRAARKPAPQVSSPAAAAPLMPGTEAAHTAPGAPGAPGAPAKPAPAAPAHPAAPAAAAPAAPASPAAPATPAPAAPAAPAAAAPAEDAAHKEGK